MRKFIAYFFMMFAVLATLWFSIMAAITPYGEPGRGKMIVGLGISLLVSIVLAAYGNSLPWKKDNE